VWARDASPVVGASRNKKNTASLKKRDHEWIGLQRLLLWAIMIVSYFASPYVVFVSFVDV
jgi:hypothetical protein